MNNYTTWEQYTDIFADSLFELLNLAFDGEFEYDPWDHENGVFSIQVWLRHFIGSVVLEKGNRTAYIDTALNNESDITPDNLILLQKECHRLNECEAYHYEILDNKFLYLNHQIELSEDSHLAVKAVFDAIIEINNWAHEWYINNWSKTMCLSSEPIFKIRDGILFEYVGHEDVVVVPDEVKKIHHAAFAGCNNMKRIVLPDTVAEIDDFAFHGCAELADNNGFVIIRGTLYDYFGNDKNIIVPYGTYKIGKSAFSGCTNITSIKLPEGITSIGDWAFKGCTSLESVSLPTSLITIGEYAFYGCDHITELLLPQSLNTIGDYAFKGCIKMSHIKLPNGVTHISDSTFYGCRCLSMINIPEGVTVIGDSAFYGCSSLESIALPESLSVIWDDAFSGCSNIKSISLPAGKNASWLSTIDRSGTLSKFIL